MKIKHDFHIHTSLSICADETATLDNYIENAKKFGLEKIGISNHFWDSVIPIGDEFYRIQDYAHVSELKPEIEAKRTDGLKIYFGCETEYDLKRGDVAISEETAEKFDFILVPNSHTHITMPKDLYEPRESHMNYMIKAYEDIINSKISKYITAIAHPFEAVGCPYDNEILINMIPDDTFKRLFDKTAQKGIAFEINTYSMNDKTKEKIDRCAQIRMFNLAKASGCKFIFGSDAHKSSGHDCYSNAQYVADLIGLKETDIIEIAR